VGPSSGAGICLGWTVPLVLESGRVVPSGGIARTTVCHWGRWAVVTWQLVIGPFELKFDCLNMNLTV
jgi:hypothetical protein